LPREKPSASVLMYATNGEGSAHGAAERDDPRARGRCADGAPGGLGAAPDAAGSSLSTSLQEQLGLQLRAQAAAVMVLVVEHVEMPTPN
jgi:Protein of unknown function (DUF3738).